MNRKLRLYRIISQRVLLLMGGFTVCGISLTFFIYVVYYALQKRTGCINDVQGTSRLMPLPAAAFVNHAGETPSVYSRAVMLWSRAKRTKKSSHWNLTFSSTQHYQTTLPFGRNVFVSFLYRIRIFGFLLSLITAKG